MEKMKMMLVDDDPGQKPPAAVSRGKGDSDKCGAECRPLRCDPKITRMGVENAQNILDLHHLPP